VKRFSRFQVDSPWRISTRLNMGEGLGMRGVNPAF
jgi:hypothetical protein